jgi:hypothetical protein
MRPVWAYVMTLIGGVVLALLVAVVLAFLIGTHNSNMSVSTGNHIVWIIFLVVFAIGTLRLILVLISKGSHGAAARSRTHRNTTNAIDYSRSSRTSNRAASTTNNTISRSCGCSGGRVTCPSCGGRGRHIGNSGKYDQSCVTCSGGTVTCGKCGGSGKVT